MNAYIEKIHAFEDLVTFVVASGDEEAIAALAVLVTPPPLQISGTPPGILGAATNEAIALANQLAKTGLAAEWATPPRHSKAMERLLHRLVVLMEHMANLWEQAPTTYNPPMDELT